MSKQRKFILIAALIGLIATFLPWITVSAGMFGVSMNNSVNGFHGIGILYFILMLAVAVIAALMGNQTELLDKTMRLAVLGGGAIAAICALMVIKDAFGNDGGMGIVNISLSIGAYLGIAAALGVIVLPLVFKNPGESLQGDFDNLKKKIQAVSAHNTANTAADPAANARKMEELEKLIDLKTAGKISEEEYQNLKAKIMM